VLKTTLPLIRSACVYGTYSSSPLGYQDDPELIFMVCDALLSRWCCLWWGQWWM